MLPFDGKRNACSFGFDNAAASAVGDSQRDSNCFAVNAPLGQSTAGANAVMPTPSCPISHAFSTWLALQMNELSIFGRGPRNQRYRHPTPWPSDRAKTLALRPIDASRVVV